MTAPPVSLADALAPWSQSQTRAMLERYWELRHSRSPRRWYPIGRVGQSARELTCTISYWIESVDQSCRQNRPDLDWGSSPIIMRWLMARDRAEERGRAANESQEQLLRSAAFDRPLPRRRLREIWRGVDRALAELREIEYSEQFEEAMTYLGVAFAACAAQDQTFSENGEERKE